MKTQISGVYKFKLTVVALASLILLQSALVTANAEDFSNNVTTRISEKTIGGFAQSNGASFNPRVSKNGRFIAFESTATNLVPDPFSNIDWDSSDNSRRRIYLYDRQANSLELVSLTGTNSDSPNTDIKADAFNAVVSNDGRYVAFTVAYDPSVPMRDIVNVCLDEVCHVHVAHEGQHIYVRDRIANDTMLVTQVTERVRRQVVANGIAVTEADAACGRKPVMETISKRVAARVIADCTDKPPYDNSTNRCASMPGRFSVAQSDNARISSDGRYIVYDTDSNSLSWVRETNTLPYPAPSASGNLSGADYEYCCNCGSPGTFVSNEAGSSSGVVNSLRNSAADTLYEWSIFTSAYDDATYGEWYRDDGSKDRKIRDIYLRDGADYSTTLLSNFCKYHEPGVRCDIEAVEDAIKPSISDDGTLISFETKSPLLSLDFNIGHQNDDLNLPNAGDDVYVIKRSEFTGEIASISRISNDTSRLLAGNGNSTEALLSADGRYIVYQSTASNLVATDNNSLSDIFIFDRNFGRTLLCSKMSNGAQLDAASSQPTISGSGEYISFESAATNTAYTGAFGNISQAYIAKVSKNPDGSAKDCALQLASPADGQGANQSALGTGIAVVPQTVVSGGITSRVQRSSIVYESAASNLDSAVNDNNSTSDIFQAPICSELDRTTDTDGDLTTDCFDQCFTDPVRVEDSDSDSDGFANCEDGCPSDPQKNGAGSCGCGIPDIDSDADGSFDCNDNCPNDPAKTEVGSCGCGVPDTDADANGKADCNDSNIPGPSPIATPVRTATPTPTATPDLTSVFTNLNPIKPSLRRGRLRGSLLLSASSSNVPAGVDVTGFNAEFTCQQAGITKTYRKSNTLGGVIKGFRSGQRCTVRVVLRGTFAGKSLLSRQSVRSSATTVP